MIRVNPDDTKQFIDDDGRWCMEMRVMDLGYWSMITGEAARVRRDFPWWKLWRWPGLWLERRRCRRMAAQGPLNGISFDGVARQDGNQITQCEINEMRLVAPPGYEERR